MRFILLSLLLALSPSFGHGAEASDPCLQALSPRPVEEIYDEIAYELAALVRNPKAKAWKDPYFGNPVAIKHDRLAAVDAHYLRGTGLPIGSDAVGLADDYVRRPQKTLGSDSRTRDPRLLRAIESWLGSTTPPLPSAPSPVSAAPVAPVAPAPVPAPEAVSRDSFSAEMAALGLQHQAFEDFRATHYPNVQKQNLPLASASSGLWHYLSVPSYVDGRAGAPIFTLANIGPEGSGGAALISSFMTWANAFKFLRTWGNSAGAAAVEEIYFSGPSAQPYVDTLRMVLRSRALPMLLILRDFDLLPDTASSPQDPGKREVLQALQEGLAALGYRASGVRVVVVSKDPGALVNLLPSLGAAPLELRAVTLLTP